MNRLTSFPQRLRIPALLGVVLELILACLVAADATGTPPVSRDPLKVDLLGVFAHPDDETGAAGTLVTYALGRGKTVANVYCTRGEGGGNMVGTQYGPALGILREGELRECLGLMGIRHCFFLDRADFAYTESLAITLEKWGHEATLERLVRLIRILRPEVVVTMNPAPNPGQHGNHQAAGLLAIEAFDAAARRDRFPEQLTLEGLSPWQVRKLYHGGAPGAGATIDVTQPLPDGRIPATVAGMALAHHRSQGFGGMASSPWLRPPQTWVLVKTVVPFDSGESDLFRGLPVADPISPIPSPRSESTPDNAPKLAFVPRPAVEFYQDWVRQHGIGHVAAAFEPDIPVVAGEASPILIDAPASMRAAVGDPANWSLPAGWTLVGRATRLGTVADGRQRLAVQVRPPEGHPADAEIRVSFPGAAVSEEVKARLHPVPQIRANQLRTDPDLDAPLDGAVWKTLPEHPIESGWTWQGTATGPADCSGRFRVARNATHLWIEIRVHDDVVVTNIEPNDIKGHWRSDSVELCLDPQPGSAHTLGCYKLGIFPSDTTGRVRGSRDADANPGVVESTSPGTRIHSARTPDGYLIRAAIPFSEIAPKGRSIGTRLGFNVLIYDGDKADAVPGENINRVRLAWAPRSGVQGRPEDWGRLDLQ